MLKVTPIEGGVNVTAYGTGLDLVDDICHVIGSIYHSISEQPDGAKLAKGFKIAIQTALVDDSPVWDREQVIPRLEGTILMEDRRRDQ